LPLVVSQRLFEHAVQVAPAAPHWLSDCEEYGTHAPPLQQPFGQEIASQTHRPLLHSRPDAHAAQAAPAAPHELPDSEAYGTHVPPLQQPFGQEVASQMH
jgi:hypothetical protein